MFAGFINCTIRLNQFQFLCTRSNILVPKKKIGNCSFYLSKCNSYGLIKIKGYNSLINCYFFFMLFHRRGDIPLLRSHTKKPFHPTLFWQVLTKNDCNVEVLFIVASILYLLELLMFDLYYRFHLPVMGLHFHADRILCYL